MDVHNLDGPHACNAAWAVGVASATGSGVVAFLAATTPEVANGGVYVGLGGLVLGVAGLVVQVVRIVYADRQGQRAAASNASAMRSELAILREQVAFLREVVRRPAASSPASPPEGSPPP